MDQGRKNLSRYAAPGRLTSPGAYAELVEAVPTDPAGIARTLQGLVIHEHLVGEYGVTLSDADRQSVHLRPGSWSPATRGHAAVPATPTRTPSG
ncbi:hypothetical protein [Micromonospora endophytica]|uniref:Uncharacterized protein n=1 Tax=Micromonospora endophytica TaxID=515350 RepID=A0A2W2C7C8_9ACTN|nr:hypothetical protein [Micromonospora endophytica]PZF87848.1 hypothetical protein C1I93_25705 [Micromonospora endophytica]RIW49144.1 hypothetical protein D3H59_05240 [Micromonospora endophytica]BCJ59095.1 hypothetical protein Jiend_25170 [Micromonospora endophytica]